MPNPLIPQRPLCLTPIEAKRKIILILREGNFVPLPHCREAMVKRDVSGQDLLHLLQHGDIISPPEWDDKHLNWRYKVEGVDLEGDDLRAITVIIETNLTLLVVTVF